MKYCLINPSSRGNDNCPNIGLAYVSAVLKKCGHEVTVIDYALMPFPKKRHLRKEYDVYGFSVKSNTFDEVRELATELHEKHGGGKEIWLGGPMTTLDRNTLSNAMPFADIKSLFFDEEIMVSEFGSKALGSTKRVFDLDDVPFPDYTTFDSFTKMKQDFKTGKLIYPLITSRGCPEKCKFCPVPIIGGGLWRKRSPDNVIEELLAAIDQFRFEHVQVLDDNATVDVRRWKKFCEILIELQESGKLSSTFKWMCPNGIRADLGDDEMYELMGRAGCYYATVGFEHIKPDLLAGMIKGETYEQIVEGIHLMGPHFRKARDRLGIAWGGVGAFFIIGLPGATRQDDEDCLAWANEHKEKGVIDLYHFNLYSPYAGTPWWDDPQVQAGLIGNYTDSIHFGEGLKVTYATEDYPAEDRVEMMKKAGFAW
jgi:radical SAM superfamily enzyme YgiQ (UPF0313 family)